MLPVALLAEGVDRNFFGEFIEELPEVALLAEGVDRNHHRHVQSLQVQVALLAEGVDRNREDTPRMEDAIASPSSRRAWIEMRKRPEQRAKLWCRPPRGGRG